MAYCIWGPGLFSNDIADTLRHEYPLLLSIGLEAPVIEELLLKETGLTNEKTGLYRSIFWLTMAQLEWKKGRLTPGAKEKALQLIRSGEDLSYWAEAEQKKRQKHLNQLEELLLSPMPPAKKVAKPTMHRCPWQAGSLLAYEITTDTENLGSHPCFHHYALLRVLRVDRSPISKLIPDYYTELMMVGLYGWIGTMLPKPEIAQDLEYIAFSKLPLQLPWETIMAKLPESLQQKVQNQRPKPISEYCEYLDWRPLRGNPQPLTFLGVDPDFASQLPEGLLTSPCRAFSHFISMDNFLCKRLHPYLEGLSPDIDLRL